MKPFLVGSSATRVKYKKIKMIIYIEFRMHIGMSFSSKSIHLRILLYIYVLFIANFYHCRSSDQISSYEFEDNEWDSKYNQIHKTL